MVVVVVNVVEVVVVVPVVVVLVADVVVLVSVDVVVVIVVEHSPHSNGQYVFAKFLKKKKENQPRVMYI